jgi:gas vesicle protein
MSNDSKLLVGIMLGAAAGALLGVLFAPNSGKETRESIKQKTKHLKEELEVKIEAIDKSTLNDLKKSCEDIKEVAADEYQNIAKQLKELENDIELRVKKLKALLNNSNSQSA